MSELTQDEIRRRLATDPDFVAIKRVDYSLAKLEQKYPENCPPRIVAAALQCSEDAVHKIYERVMAQLRQEVENG